MAARIYAYTDDNGLIHPIRLYPDTASCLGLSPATNIPFSSFGSPIRHGFSLRNGINARKIKCELKSQTALISGSEQPSSLPEIPRIIILPILSLAEWREGKYQLGETLEFRGNPYVIIKKIPEKIK